MYSDKIKYLHTDTISLLESISFDYLILPVAFLEELGHILKENE